MPSQRLDPLPAPKVRLIFPLTQSDPEDRLAKMNRGRRRRERLRAFEASQKKRRSAGLLVVLSEAWFETAGIGEGIEAQVELTPTPYTYPPTKYFYQLGPDVTAHYIDESRLFNQEFPAGDQSVRFESILGPVGHYYDADNNTALMVGTSFVLPPPSVPASKDGPMDWYQAKVAFRRTLDARYPATPTGLLEYPPANLNEWPLKRRYSLYTEPTWVQFLPEFSLYDGFDGHVSELLLDPKDKTATLRQSDGTPVVLSPTEGPVPGEFQLYLVLTRKVVDVTGRADQEAYLGLYLQGEDGDWTANGAIFDSARRSIPGESDRGAASGHEACGGGLLANEWAHRSMGRVVPDAIDGCPRTLRCARAHRTDFRTDRYSPSGGALWRLRWEFNSRDGVSYCVRSRGWLRRRYFRLPMDLSGRRRRTATRRRCRARCAGLADGRNLPRVGTYTGGGLRSRSPGAAGAPSGSCRRFLRSGSCRRYWEAVGWMPWYWRSRAALRWRNERSQRASMCF